MIFGNGINYVANKFLRINNTQITGVEANTAKGTNNSITYDNAGFVLIEVYGV